MPQQAPPAAFVNGQAGSTEMDSTGSARNGDEVLNQVSKSNILSPCVLHFCFSQVGNPAGKHESCATWVWAVKTSRLGSTFFFVPVRLNEL